MSKSKIKQMKKEFSLRRGTAINGVNGNVIGQELTKIYAENGKLTAPIVVDSARPEDAALHPVFEWDDEVAGERWREYEARALIKMVQVNRPNEQGKPVETPVFYYIPTSTKEKGEYHTTDVVVSRPDMLMLALTQLQSQMSAVERSIETLKTAAHQKGDQDFTARITLAAMAFAAARDAVAALH